MVMEKSTFCLAICLPREVVRDLSEYLYIKMLLWPGNIARTLRLFQIFFFPLLAKAFICVVEKKNQVDVGNIAQGVGSSLKRFAHLRTL